MLKYAILGYLSWKPLSGYDLKKVMINAVVSYWSGNNNQIYKTLVELSKHGFVHAKLEHQEKNPSRKIYSITPEGLTHLREWITSPTEEPIMRSTFLIQLSWADLLTEDELDILLQEYLNELEETRLMFEEKARRRLVFPGRTTREQCIWEEIHAHAIDFYRFEMDWIGSLKQKLKMSTD